MLAEFATIDAFTTIDAVEMNMQVMLGINND